MEDTLLLKTIIASAGGIVFLLLIIWGTWLSPDYSRKSETMTRLFIWLAVLIVSIIYISLKYFHVL